MQTQDNVNVSDHKPTVAEAVLSPGPWSQLIGYRNVLCPDGKRRTVRNIGQPDSAFSAPGRITYRGISVSGFITGTGNAIPSPGSTVRDSGRYDMKFVPTGKHAQIFGRWIDGRELPQPLQPSEGWYWSRNLGCWSNYNSGIYVVADENGILYDSYGTFRRHQLIREGLAT